MNRNLLFNCACVLTNCDSCLLDKCGCDGAPVDILLKQARKHYAEMRRSEKWERYNGQITKYYGADYAKELAIKARVV